MGNTLTLSGESIHGLRICLIPGGFPDTRLESAYKAFQKGDIDYIVTAMRYGKDVGRQLQERGIHERKLLIPDERYFLYATTLGDLTGAKAYLKEYRIFQKTSLTKIVAQRWCAPRFLMTAWRLGYPRPHWIRAEDPRPFFSRKSFDIVEELLADFPAYLTLAMPNPDFYLRSIEPKLQKVRRILIRH